MERQVILHDYQEFQAQDGNDLQDFARASLDHVVYDVVTKTRKYAGFNVTKTAQTEVQIAPGRFYDVLGVIFNLPTTTVQSMIAYLPAVAQRIVTISAYGVESETDVEERDILVNTETMLMEPQAVATVRSRDAVIAFSSGAESTNPQPPVTPIANVPIAQVLLDPIQVVSVTMLTDNAINSLSDIDSRTDALELFEGQVGPRLSSLASDLAALQNEIRSRSFQTDLTRVYIDLARVKERVEIPSAATDYGADRFLDTDDSDTADAQSYGYDATVMEGVRFADANADEEELGVFSANDPNAAVQDGTLLPAFDSAFRMGIYPLNSDLGMAQYGFQTFDLIEKTIARERLRYGAIFTVCTNSAWWQSGTYNPVTQTFRIGDETWNVLDIPDTAGGGSHFPRLQQFWLDTYTETYWSYIVVEHQISGAQVAQTFLNANDMWLTKLRLFFTAKGGNEDVWVTLCEVTNGVPNLDAVILHQSLAHANMVVGDWTSVNLKPTFLERGKRYAVVLTSNTNHKIGMASGQSYLQGTFFSSTDGAFYQGDLTKDMMLELWGAKFRASQVVIELNALNLDGGLRNLDMIYGAVVPQSTQLLFEVQPGGSGAWIPLSPENLTAFDGAPPLCRFRARFVGTPDMQPGLVLTGSRVRMSRPKVAFKHISTLQTLATASASIHVQLMLENFDDTPHDCTCRIHLPGGWENPDTTVTETLSAAEKRYQRTFNFTGLVSGTDFTIEINGTTNSASSMFHVAERVHWAT